MDPSHVPYQMDDFVRSKKFCTRREVDPFFWHAIKTAQIAPFRQRYSEVRVLSPVRPQVVISASASLTRVGRLLSEVKGEAANSSGSGRGSQPTHPKVSVNIWSVEHSPSASRSFLMSAFHCGSSSLHGDASLTAPVEQLALA